VSGVGSPICTDVATSKPMIERTFGQFARVLVDIDLSQTLRHRLLVERTGFAFYVDLEYENFPDYCSYCKTIGHHIDYYRRYYPEEPVVNEKERMVTKKQAKEPKKVFVQTRYGRLELGKEAGTSDVNK